MIMNYTPKINVSIMFLDVHICYIIDTLYVASEWKYAALCCTSILICYVKFPPLVSQFI